jgi:ribosomal-protein-alanine N-acetyltransferase
VSAVWKGDPQPAPDLEPMREADLDDVMAIENAIYSHPWTRGNFADSLRAGYACHVWRADRKAGAELIGYFVLMAAAGEGHLLNLSIAGPWQRSGCGSALLREVAQLAGKLGALNLFLEVRPSNLAAQSLYRRFGFRKVAVRRDYYPAQTGREDALVLSLPLA